jgi:hypothetical protein
MMSPLPLPDWVPWWVHLVIMLGALLFGLLFLLMPFSVLGVKARLEGIEARLDEIQGEIRSLALRRPETMDDGYASPDGRGMSRPPIPPAPHRAEPRIVRPAGRTEPRLY